MIRNSFAKHLKRSAVSCLLMGAVVIGGCGDDPTGVDENVGGGGGGNEPPPVEDVVLFESTVNGPIEFAGQGFTTVTTFAGLNNDDIEITVTSSLSQSNVLIDVGLAQGGFSRNQAQFQDGDANPATLTVTNPQPQEGNALRIADGAGVFQNAVYTIRVIQIAE